jgi:hypothetical protein
LRFIAQLRDQNEEEQRSKVSEWYEASEEELKAIICKATHERI